jgi:protein TonB
VNETVDRLLTERAALDRGFSRGLAVSGLAHSLLVIGAVAIPLLLPKKPLINIAEGFVVALPPGGGGSPSSAPPAPAPPAPQPQPEAPQPLPPPKVLKPPKEEPKKGLPELDSKKPKKTAKTTPTPGRAAAAGGPPSATGKNSQTPGVGLEVGPGIPGGTDPSGDWYLAGVQRKIWTLWTQQIRGDMAQHVIVRFTILSDGSLEGAEVLQASGTYLLDNAALRAVTTAAPFSPLPKHYETTRLTIQAVFKPTT